MVGSKAPSITRQPGLALALVMESFSLLLYKNLWAHIQVLRLDGKHLDVLSYVTSP